MRRRALRAAADVAAVGSALYMAAMVLLAPLHTRWGATEAELRQVLPGDELAPDAYFQIQHAVTIRAPLPVVWPWLAQIGQDRGGFYSYSRLENLVGARVRNADRVHPEWQRLSVGDLVRATPPGWLFGVNDAHPGWTVARVEWGRVLVLDGWGAFVLAPVDRQSTRLTVRTRYAGPDGLAWALAPFDLLVFQPIHFAMERRMLLGIRERAEREWSRHPPLPDDFLASGAGARRAS